MRILAVIPARGGSKGIRRKNIRFLGDRPLLQYQIENAVRSSYITDTVVTTDESSIANFSGTFPVAIRKRPHLLASDSIPLDPVVHDATEYMEALKGTTFDYVVTLQPTSPLLSAEKVDEAIKMAINEDYDSVVSVVNATHLYWIRQGNAIRPDYEERVNRQWLPQRFRETGGLLVTKRAILESTSRFGESIGCILLQTHESIDIDSEDDWLIAAAFLHRLRVAFVVNGSSSVGLGHVYRVMAVADSLLGNEVYVIAFSPEKRVIGLLEDYGLKVLPGEFNEVVRILDSISPDIVVNDFLDTTEDYVSSLHARGFFVVDFEDLGGGSEKANLVFNSLYERSNPASNHRYGHRYECLSEKFFYRNPIDYRKVPETMMITFGGVDHNNLTCRVIGLLPRILASTPLRRFLVVTGPTFAHHDELTKAVAAVAEPVVEIHSDVGDMPSLMQESDIAITSNGRTVHELAAMGIPTISIAQNDRETLHLFARYHKGTRYLGIVFTVTDQDVLSALSTIANDDCVRRVMYDAQIAAASSIRAGTRRVSNEMISQYWMWKNEVVDH